MIIQIFYTHRQMFSFYPILKLFISYVHHLLYRNVTILGQDNVPQSGPTILFANHNNFYLDGSILMSGVNRNITLTVSSTVFKRPLLKNLLDRVDTISIDRPKDFARAGTGHVVRVTADRMTGSCTSFTSILTNQTIYCQKEEYRVISVVSDEEMIIANPKNIHAQGKFDFKIYPKFDRAKENALVEDELCRGKVISIFPEGVTHDQLQLLPFKKGICVTAFNMLEKKNILVNLVPAGIIYHNHHMSRSRVFLKFGPPITITPQLHALYKCEPKQAIQELKNLLQSSLKALLIETTQFQTIQPLITCRKLWCRRSTTNDEKLTITQTFARAFQTFKDDAQTQQLKAQLTQYTDHRHPLPHLKPDDVLPILMSVLGKVVVAFVLLVPGLVIFELALLMIKNKVEHTRQMEVGRSDFRIKGYDVIGTYTFLHAVEILPLNFLVLICLSYFVYPLELTSLMVFSCVFCVLSLVYTVFYVKIWDIFIKQCDKLYHIIKTVLYPSYRTQSAHQRQKLKHLLNSWAGKHPELFLGFE